MQAPTMSDGTVTLRPHRPDDVPALVAAMADAESRRWMVGVPDPYTAADGAAWLAECARGWASDRAAVARRAFAVELEGRFAGQIVLSPSGPGAAVIGYDLAPWARGRGAMSAAVRLALGWAFAHWADPLPDDAATHPLDVVLWRCSVGNWASRRVAWACGFAVEGRVRGLQAVRGGGRRDAWVGSLRRDDDLRPATLWVEVPVVGLGHVVLRPWRPEDAVRVVEACSQPSTALWLPNLPDPYTEPDAVRFLAAHDEAHSRGDALHWAVADAGDDRLLGALSLMGLAGGTSRSAEIGYWTHPDARGRGVMTTAVRAAARHALLELDDGGLGLARVLIRVAAPNTASRRVAEKAGFTQTGVDRRAERLRDGRVVDFVRYDHLADELDAARAHPASLR